ncbi:MAG: hypothetical protein ABSA79_00065 [Candidatus Bathyarchaeia archaeon]|jgi:hypothetical protein
MGKLNINVKRDVDARFRTEVFKRKGFKKGNLKEAVEEAMILWISTSQNSNKEEEFNKQEEKQS